LKFGMTSEIHAIVAFLRRDRHRRYRVTCRGQNADAPPAFPLGVTISNVSFRPPVVRGHGGGRGRLARAIGRGFRAPRSSRMKHAARTCGTPSLYSSGRMLLGLPPACSASATLQSAALQLFSGESGQC
jgi:hypothetical protein